MGFFASSLCSAFILCSSQANGCPAQWLLLFSHSVVSGSFVTAWTVACQAPLSMGFPRQEYWCGLPFPSSGHLPDPGWNPCLLHHRRSLSRRVAREALHTGGPCCGVTSLAGFFLIADRGGTWVPLGFSSFTSIGSPAGPWAAAPGESPPSQSQLFLSASAT